MATIAVTDAWLDPSSSLTTGTTYVVQNRSTSFVQFFEGPSFSDAANGNDGVMLSPLHDPAAAPNFMRWVYDATNQVRLRMTNAPFGEAEQNIVVFVPAT